MLSLTPVPVVLLLSGTLVDWENKTLDYRFKLRGTILEDPHIILIDIDDQTLESLGTWPINRSLHARMIRRLKDWGVAVVAYDVVFANPGEAATDEKLILETQNAGNVIFATPFELTDDFDRSFSTSEANLSKAEALKRFRYPLTPHEDDLIYRGIRVVAPLVAISEAALGIGHTSATPDSDGVFRRIPLVIEYQGHLFPSLALQVLMHYLQVDPMNISVKAGRFLTLKEAIFPDRSNPILIQIPIDQRAQMLVNYVGEWGRSFTHYTFVELLNLPDNSPIAKEFKGKLVVVNAVATGIGDIGPTPLERDYPLGAIHANILNTVLTENFLKEVGTLPNVSMMLFLACLPGLLSLRWRMPVVTGLTGMVVLAYLMASFLLFKYAGQVMWIVRPILSTGLGYLTVTVYRYSMEEQELRRLRIAFERYLSPQILKQVVTHPEAVSLGGARKELTILFSDIKGFTSLSEKADPEDVIGLLNRYFDEMTEVVFQYGGTVDKFMGDGLMAFYGDPMPCEDHALRAVKSAIEMQKRVGAMKDWLNGKGFPPIQIRIGISTGYVTVGNVGSKRRMEYTALGRYVNLAKRLESKAEPGGILVSHRTYWMVKDVIPVEPLGNLEVKGFEEPVEVYKILF